MGRGFRAPFIHAAPPAKPQNGTHMEQTRIESAIETVTDIAVAFFISWAYWVFVVAPWQGIDRDYVQSFEITCAFTVLALVRRYITRRFFANRFHHAVHNLVRRLFV